MESTTINNDINAIKKVRKLFNERKSNLSREETKKIREKLYKKEVIYNFLKEKDSLTNKEKTVLKNIDKYIKNLKKYLKKHSKRFRKYSTTYDLDYLFNELNELTINNNINATKEVRKVFNENRSNLIRKETKKIRENLYKKESKYNSLKEKEQKDSLTNEEKKKLKNIDKYRKNLKKDLEKLQKYQYNITYGLDNLLNEDYYYEPKEIKSDFDGSNMLMKAKEIKMLN